MSLLRILSDYRKGWKRSLFFIMILLSFESQCFSHKVSGSIRKQKRMYFSKCLLCGKSLEGAYARAIALNSGEYKKFSAREIIECAENANNKSKENITFNEKVALRLVVSATNYLAEIILAKALKSKSQEVYVLIFGGITVGHEDFLKKILLQKIYKINSSNKVINIIFSEMGDERAILGAIKYAESKMNYCNYINNQYAIGIDIGGTNLRAALFDFKKKSLIGNLVKQPVFIDEYSEKRMHYFCNRINSAVNASKKGNFNLNKLEDFLKDKLSQTEYELLTELVIKRICDLIKNLRKGLNVKFIAISSAGVIDEKGFCLCAYNLPFTCVDIRQRIEDITNIPTFVANDIKCAALGEKKFGALKFVDKFIIVGLGTGVGLREFDFTDGICQEVGLTDIERVLFTKVAF